MGTTAQEGWCPPSFYKETEMNSIQQNTTALTTQLSCQVTVTGDPSSEEDRSIPGTYDFEVRLKRAVDPAAMTIEEKSEIACQVLDCFHDRIGIDFLDDFSIVVALPGGREIVEDGSHVDDLVARVSYNA